MDDTKHGIISIAYARRLLGKSGKGISDDEIRKLLLGYQVLANLVIEKLAVPKSNEYDDYKSHTEFK